MAKLGGGQTNFKITLGTCVFKKSCSTLSRTSSFFGGFCHKVSQKSCSKNYEEKIKRNLVLRDFQKIMLKKIPIKNKKKCRFATKAQKLLKKEE